MHYISKSLRALKAVLPESYLQFEPAYGDADQQRRSQAVAVLSQLGAVFAAHPRVLEIAVFPDGDAGESEVNEPAVLNVSFTIAAVQPGEDPGTVTLSTIESKIRRIAHTKRLEALVGARLDWGGLASAIAANGSSLCERGNVVLTREAYLNSLVGRSLDVDAFFSRRKGSTGAVASQQALLSRPPAYWNRSTVAGIPERLREGMDAGACDLNGVSALLAAAVFGENDGAVKALCAAGADPNAVDATGHSAVSAAIAVENWPGFRLLVEAGGDPNGPKYMPALLVALETASANVAVSQLLEAGVDVTRVMPDGMPFNSPLERFEPKYDQERQWAWQKVVQAVRSHSIAAGIAGTLSDDGSPSAQRRTSVGLSL